MGSHRSRGQKSSQRIPSIEKTSERPLAGGDLVSQLETVPVILIENNSLKPNTPSKRKPQSPNETPPRMNKRPNAAAQRDQRAQITLFPTRYFQVHVDAQHRNAIASSCGLTDKDVREVLAIDNYERRAKTDEVMCQPSNEDELLTDADWEDL